VKAGFLYLCALARQLLVVREDSNAGAIRLGRKRGGAQTDPSDWRGESRGRIPLFPIDMLEYAYATKTYFR